MYDESLGYYQRDAPTVGRDGDYLTSSEVHPLFSYAVATLAARLWELSGSTDSFVLREVGPGTGSLVEGIATWAAARRPDFAAALRFELVEPSSATARRQQRRLAPLGERVSWLDDLRAPLEGLLFANELLDAQPVHRLRWQQGRWEELYVSLDESGGFIDHGGVPSCASLLEPLATTAPRDGQVVEVSPAISQLVGELADSLDQGLLLLLDYGYEREQLYAPWRREGTLLTYYRHTPGSNPYVRIGEQDMSCHIDIEAVARAARERGLTPLPIRSQAQFLSELGATGSPDLRAREAALEVELSRRRAVEVLTDPEGLGRIQVMAFSRSLEQAPEGLH